MSTIRELDLLLQGFVDKGLPGCGLEVRQRGNVIYEGYFGYADCEAQTKISRHSVFRQASLSKIPLYTTAMILYEQGKFLLSDPLWQYLPEWRHCKKYVLHPNGSVTIKETDRPLTIQDVLSMKCGLPYCNSDVSTEDLTLASMQENMQPLWEKGHYTLQEEIKAMSKAIQAFEPGTHWLYGFSSELVAGLIEVICEKSIDDVFKSLLFEPLEMRSTGSHFFGDISERLVKLYQKDENGLLSPGPSWFDKKHLPGEENQRGWARLFSTVNDYGNMLEMLANGGLLQNRSSLGRKTIDLMRCNGLNTDQLMDFQDTYNAGYGYGLGVRTLIQPEKGNHNGSLGAFGWTGGFGTWAEADPSEGLSIVYMHNQIPNEELYVHHRVRTAVYGLIE